MSRALLRPNSGKSSNVATESTYLTTPGLSRATGAYLFAQTAIERLLLFIIPITIYRQTGRLSVSGLAYVVEWLPVVLLLPVAGALVDRWPGATVLRVTNATRMAMVALATVAVIMEWPSAVLIAVGGALGLANIFAYIAFERYAASFPPERLSAAYSYFQSLQYIMLLAMPIVGAVAMSASHLPLLLGACAATYAIFSLLRIPFDGPAVGDAKLVRWREMASTTRVLLARPPVRAYILLVFAANLTLAVMYTALPALTDGEHADLLLPLGYGAAAVISLVYMRLSVTVERRGLTARVGVLVALSTTAVPAALVLTPSPLAASLVFAIAIGPMVAFTVWSRIVRNRLIDRRTFALQASVMMVGTTLASPVAGVYLLLVGDHLAPRIAVGTVSAASVLCLVLALRSLRRGRVLGS